MATTQVKEIDLTLGPSSKSSGAAATCHLMPCSIQHDQLRVKAKEYFWPTVRELKIGGDQEQGRSLKHDKSISQVNDKEPVLLASFRGRPLQGKRVELPDGFVGHVIERNNNKADSTGGDRRSSVKKHFRQFTYWNWDQLPNENDSVVKALNWLQIAKTIHNSVE